MQKRLGGGGGHNDEEEQEEVISNEEVRVLALAPWLALVPYLCGTGAVVVAPLLVLFSA